MYCILFFSANCYASSVVTTLSEERSSFVPTNNLTRASFAVVSTCLAHAARLANELAYVRSKAKMMPRAPLK